MPYKDIEEKKRHSREYYAKNRELIREKHKQYYEDNTDKLKARGNQYYLANKEKHQEWCRNNYLKNIDRRKQLNKEWRVRNKDKIKEAQSTWALRNKDKVAAYRKTSYIRHRPSVIFHAAHTSAKKRNLEFSLTKEDIVIPSHCPYFGLPLDLQSSNKNHLIPSIDRIDNNKGYVKGNIQIISYLANQMKRDASIEQLIAFAKGVLRIHDRASSNQVSS